MCLDARGKWHAGGAKAYLAPRVLFHQQTLGLCLLAGDVDRRPPRPVDGRQTGPVQQQELHHCDAVGAPRRVGARHLLERKWGSVCLRCKLWQLYTSSEEG